MTLKLLQFQSVSVFERRTFCRRRDPYGNMSSPQRISCRGSSNGYYVSKKTECSVDHLRKNTIQKDFLFGLNGKNLAGPISIPPTICVLNGSDDEYGGFIVDPNRLPADPDVFASCLRFSLAHWKIKGKKGVWLKLPLHRAELVPVSVKEGFEYHHAEPGYVMLTRWLPGGSSKLPGNASHQVGIGGFVINDQNEILVVQEKFCAPSFCGLWKIPTGYILEAEEIYAGAIREVKEETGIDTEFEEIVAFRHAQNLAFDKSDLFFVCMLKPVSYKIKLDDHEIQAAKWMPLPDFVNQPMIQDDSMFKRIVDICLARLGKQYCGLTAEKLLSKFDGRLSCLYYNIADADEAACDGC